MTEKTQSSRPLIFPALGFSIATGGPPAIALSLLLVDISGSFNTPIGVMGQISTVSSLMSIIMAILMGVLSVRYSHKKLMTIGLLLIAISVTGVGLSTSFNLMLVVYSLTGIGYSMVLPMTTTFIAKFYPVQNRTQAIGRLISVRSLTSMLAPIVIGYVVSKSDWRWGFVSYSIPIVVLGFFLVNLGIPSDDTSSREGPKAEYMVGMKHVLNNRSAVACLTAGALAMALFAVISIFNGSFLRQRYQLPVEMVSILMPLIAISVTIGLLSSGRLVNRFGMKKVVVLSTFLPSLMYLFYFGFRLPLEIALIFSSLGAFMTGVRITTSSSISLEQVTTYRGSMMSLNTAASSLGGVIGGLVGGFSLLRFGYGGLGTSTFILSVLASVIYYALVQVASEVS